MDERQALTSFGALSQETRLRIVRALVVAGPDGKLWGDPSCVALLTAEPLPAPTWDYTTASHGALDTLGRLLGLAGLLGLVTLRRAR